MNCPRCRVTLRDGSRFCTSCGTNIAPPLHQVPIVPLATKRRSRAPLVVSAIVLALAGGGVALGLALARRADGPILCVAGKPCAKVSRTGGTILVDTPLARVRIEVPPGALNADVAFAVDVAKDPPSFAGSGLEDKPGALVSLAMPVKLEPSGAAFEKPLAITIPFDVSLLPARFNPNDVTVAVMSDAGGKRAWETIKPLRVDLEAAELVVPMKHFSEAVPVAHKIYRTPEADPNFRQFYGLDSPTFTPAQQEARLSARCIEMERVLAHYPGLSLDSSKVPRTAFTRISVFIPFWEGSMNTLMRSYNPPMDLKNNPFSDATLKHGPPNANGKSYEAVFLDGIRASNHPLHLGEVLKIALDATGGDYSLAVLTAHNALKNATYVGRGWEGNIPPEQAQIASKLEGLRSGPDAHDKMGPWYHAFGVLMVGGLLTGNEADAFTSVEHGTRYASFLSTSRLDPEKAAVDNCAVRVAHTVASLPPTPPAPSASAAASASASFHLDAGRIGDAASDAEDGASEEPARDAAAAPPEIQDAAADDAAADDWPGLYKGRMVGKMVGTQDFPIDSVVQVVVYRAGAKLTLVLGGSGGAQNIDLTIDPTNPRAATGSGTRSNPGATAHYTANARLGHGSITLTVDSHGTSHVPKMPVAVEDSHFSGTLPRIGDAKAVKP